MHKKSQYEDLIRHLEAQLKVALVKEVELRAIYDEASSKVPLLTGVDKDGRKISGRHLTGEAGEAIKNSASKLGEYQMKVIGSIRHEISRAKEVIRIIDKANYDINEIKFSFEWQE